MKCFFSFFCLFLFLATSQAQVNPNYHYVEGYYRSNGTYVKGHYRTNRNHTNRDNYTTKPNVNPHTGKRGYIEPDNEPLPSYNSSTPTYNYSNSNTTYSSSPNSSWSTTNSTYSSYGAAISYHNQYSFADKKMLEEFLARNDFYPGEVDGVFTWQTIEAIKKMQEYIEVPVDGKFGPATLKRLSQLLE